MRRNLFFLLLLAAPCGCAHPDLVSTEKEETEARSQGATLLSVQKPVQVGDLRLNLVQVEENRCPQNVTCFWYGYAAATLRLEDANGHTVNQKLYLGEALQGSDYRGFREADTVTVQVGNKPYRLILSKVEPYPTTKNSSSAKKATVSVKPL